MVRLIEGDLRERYTNEQRLRVIKWYLEGVGIMSIERMEGVSNPLIIKWIRKFSKILRQRLNEVVIPENARDVQILELDEPKASGASCSVIVKTT